MADFRKISHTGSWLSAHLVQDYLEHYKDKPNSQAGIWIMERFQKTSFFTY